MKLTSPAFSHNEAIPTEYTCDGANNSPALEWSGEPENTQSFVLIVDDPDAPGKTWVHWLVYNIPSTVDNITKNQGSSRKEVPFLQGATDFNGKQTWGGPCPPSGTHHYHFTLYALDKVLDLPAGATKEQLLHAMQGHILEKTTLIGTYQRKK
ncbi:MAG TPA: YbhB/YbcL family Raf kinase inhibitor-like protein [Nitrosopumilaceae archaeon]|nr:YbhB/YbcL family Raf kinase inhibitor-like protein [Nitrosopumilaceae archaeon]